MKIKLISLLLAMVMLASVLLTSCSDIDTGYEEETSSIPAITLTLYGIKEEGTTDEAIALVEAAISKYTEDKYKTTVELHMYSEEEYKEVIEDAFIKTDEQIERNELAERAATAAAKAAREAAKTLPVEEQKEKKRAQREYEKWANAQDDSMESVEVEMSDDVQLDIFLVNDYSYYLDLVDRERLADISSDVYSTHSLITKYVNPIILSSAKVDNSTYGVPANRLLGAGKEGYYYAIKTDLAEKYDYEIPVLPALNLSTIDEWLERVKAGERSVVPFFAPPEVIQNFDFYMDNPEYAAYGTKNTEANETTSSEIQYTLHAGTSGGITHGTAFFHFRKMHRYRQAGFFAPEGANPATTNFAMGVFKGPVEDIKTMLGDRADEYTIVTYSYPRVVTDDVFGSTFVVSSSCKYVSRAVELIKGFCTDEALRNLITYGVEDIHYEVNLDGETITKLTNDYNMGFETYGNSLIGYVPEEYGVDYQTNSINSNMKIKSSAFVGYVHSLEEEDIIPFETINEIVAEYLPELMRGYDISNMEDVDGNGTVDINDVFEEINLRLGKEEDLLGLYPGDDEEDYEAPYLKVRANLDSAFANFVPARPTSGKEIDNNIITKDEAKRRQELLEAEEEVLDEVADEVLDETVEETTQDEVEEPIETVVE